MNHTKGAWKIEDNAEIDIVSDGSHHVAIVPRGWGDDVEEYANARLIASAPLGLELAEMIEATHQSGGFVTAKNLAKAREIIAMNKENA
jgi:hypothetical protein